MKPTNHNRRSASYAFLGLGICLLITVPIVWVTVAGIVLVIDWLLA